MNTTNLAVRLSVRLYSTCLLSVDTRKKICNAVDCSKAVTDLLDAVETAIQVDPNNFYKFLKRLENVDPVLKPLCETLRSKCGKTSCIDRFMAKVQRNVCAECNEKRHTCKMPTLLVGNKIGTTINAAALAQNWHQRTDLQPEHPFQVTCNLGTNANPAIVGMAHGPTEEPLLLMIVL